MAKGNDSAFFEDFLNHADSLDFQKVLRVILSRWYWVAGSLFIFGFSGFLFFKLVKPKYIASISVKYFDKQTELDEISSAKPTYLINNGYSEYLTEKYTIRSQEVVENAISSMHYPLTFYRLKDFRRIDIYPNKPLTIKVLSFDEIRFEHGKFLISSDLQFSYQTDDYTKILSLRKGAVISVPGLSFQIEQIVINDTFDFEFVFNNPASLASELIKRISVDEIEDQTPVLTISFKHHSKPFAKDFLEKLVEAYQIYDIQQKKQSSDLTLNFIKEQLNVYSDLLKEAADKLEVFKQSHAVIDVSNSATEISEKTRQIDQQKNQSEIQKAYILMLEKNLGNTFDAVNFLSPGLDGNTDTVLIGLLDQFNLLISKRKELLQKYSVNASSVKILDEELVRARKQILENISLQKQKNAGTLRILDQNLAQLKKQFRNIPALEKSFIYLQSTFEVNKNIYSLLMNKEIESSIVRAGILPSFKIITSMEIEKVSPKPVQIISLSTFLGLLTGMSSIFLARNLNRKFSQINLIGNDNLVQLLGIIYRFDLKKSGSKPRLNDLSTDQSIFTESVNAIRTRLSFLKINDKPHSGIGKQIMITSRDSGEGKTFVSVNLAISFAKIGRKVIVIGCDLRKSTLHQFFETVNEKGLSNFLQSKIEISDLIKTSSTPNLDYILAGPPPFNPSELLQKDRFHELLTYCRTNYDYVILDTAPVGLVSDNIPLLHESSVVIFILRWLDSEKDAYQLPRQLASDYQTDKIQIIVNDFYPDELFGAVTTNSSGPYTGSYRYSYDNRSDEYFKTNKKNSLEKLKKRFWLSD